MNYFLEGFTTGMGLSVLIWLIGYVIGKIVKFFMYAGR
jgi:hypothetical protein